MSNYLIGLFAGLVLSACAVSRADGPQAREISFKVPDLTLEGTFETPTTPGKHPALLLLPGSGPTDRDGNSMLGIKTDLLKQIADSLASHGIASFRFDKRAIRHYQNFWPKSTSELNEFFGWDKFVSDAHAAFLVLKAQPEVDPAHVGLLGHSEGSLISLQLGADTAGEPDQPAAMILIGCTGRPMGPVLHDQIQYRLKLSGASADLTKTYLDYLDAACTALADEKPLPPDTPQGLKTLFNPAVLNIVGAYCRMQPVDLAKRYRRDVLVVNGDKDTQVSAIKDTPKLVTAFRMRRTGTVEAMIVIDASHCLKSTSKGDLDQFEGPVVDGVLDRIAKFANAHL